MTLSHIFPKSSPSFCFFFFFKLTTTTTTTSDFQQPDLVLPDDNVELRDVAGHGVVRRLQSLRLVQPHQQAVHVRGKLGQVALLLRDPHVALPGLGLQPLPATRHT